MGWLEIKQKARNDVHRTFSLPATFLPKSGGATEGAARLHYKRAVFGDLDREGFATVSEAVDFVIIDTRVFVNAVEGDRVFFPQLNRAFKLSTEGEAEDGIFIRWIVIEVAP